MSNKKAYFEEDPTDFKCNKCSEAFQKPILATISSSNPVQTYYACPHCLAKVSEIRRQENEEERDVPLLMKVTKRTAIKHEENVRCKHSLGYLKNRAKDEPIPEECLTCDKMLECMFH